MPSSTETKKSKIQFIYPDSFKKGKVKLNSQKQKKISLPFMDQASENKTVSNFLDFSQFKIPEESYSFSDTNGSFNNGNPFLNFFNGNSRKTKCENFECHKCDTFILGGTQKKPSILSPWTYFFVFLFNLLLISLIYMKCLSDFKYNTITSISQVKFKYDYVYHDIKELNIDANNHSEKF